MYVHMYNQNVMTQEMSILNINSTKVNMKLQKFGAKSATTDSCFNLIGPCQCSVALGGPATSTEDLRHQGSLNKPGVLKHLWVS